MKKRTTTILIIAIATVGFIAFGFSKKNIASKTDTIELAEANIPFSTTSSFYTVGGKDTKNPDLDLFYMVKGKYSRSISEGTLKTARGISEIIPDFPSSWISRYNSAEIAVKINDEIHTASSKNWELTPEQKHLLKSVSIDNDISVTVNYKAENSVTKTSEDREMKVSFTVIPETKAEYVGGYDKMIAYIKENSLKKIEAVNIKNFNPVSIVFYVNENGKTESLKLTNSCGNNHVNNLLIEVIQNMPKWKPAINSDGEPVKQKFELFVGPDMC